jgi:hypothetical protein
MPKAIYAMGGVSADGCIVGPDGQSHRSMPDAEPHRPHSEQTPAPAGHLFGRRSTTTAVVGTR